MSAQAYFTGLARTQQRLRDHGFEAYPSVEELATYAMDLSDKLDALCETTGVDAYRDFNGRWHAVRREGV